MRQHLKLLGALTLLLTGCSQYDFRYQPVTQPDKFNPIFVDYRLTPKTVDMLVDTHGIRLISSRLTLADGSIIMPLGIDQPAFAPVRIGEVYSVDNTIGVERAQGPTIVRFDKTTIGQAPWNLMVQIAGTRQAYIMVGTATSTGYIKPLVYPMPPKDAATQPATNPGTMPTTQK